METGKKALLFIIPLLFICFLSTARQASASVTPSLVLQATGSGDSVEVDVTGDPNSSVLFYYSSLTSGLQLQSLGNTNSSGLFSTTLGSATLGIASSSPVYVKTNGVNGLQSNSVAWPYSPASNNLSLSSTGVVLPVGQSIVVTAYNNGTNLLYLSNNSNPSVANVNINGSQLTILGMTFGQTTVTVCTQGSVTGCASAYVTVTNSGSASLTFGQNSPTIASGQSLAVSINGGTGAYTVFNNPNSSVVGASISGSSITLSAMGSAGSSAITVCSTDISSCGIINVTIGNINSSAISFSQSNPTLAIGQSLSIIMTGAIDSTYSISTNSNSSVVDANISGNTLVLVGKNIGTSAISICGVSGGCNIITATVSYSSTGGRLTLSQTALSLMVGQSVTIIVSGGMTPYRLGTSASSSLIYNTVLSNNILTVSGVGAGSTSLDVCSAGGACATLAIWVNPLTSSALLSLSQTNLSLIVGGNATVSIAGNGGYYIANNSNSSVVTTSISGSSTLISGIGIGSSSITICQGGGQCNTIYVSVVAANNPPPSSDSNLYLVKVAGNTAVYAVSGNTRQLYSNEVTFWSWHTGSWSNNPVVTVSQSVFAGYTLAKNITARPGTLIKFDNSPSVYAVVSEAKLCQLASTAVADSLYGTSWYNRLMTIQGSFEADYTVDKTCKIENGAPYPDGSLIQYQNSSDTWYIQNGQKRLVDNNGLSLNNFNLNNLAKNVLTSYSYPAGQSLTTNDSAIFNLK